MIDVNNFKSLPRDIQLKILYFLNSIFDEKEVFVSINAQNNLIVGTSIRYLREQDPDCIISDAYVFEDFPTDKEMYENIVAIGDNQWIKDNDFADTFRWNVAQDGYSKNTWKYLKDMCSKIYDARLTAYNEIILDKIMEDTEWKRR